jgi:hypothetical protein
MPTAKSTQQFVPVKEVRDGIIIMKDGSFRAVIISTSLNFALKSGDEQQAIIYQFQNFLNSLDFSIQISVQSRQLDIRPYLALLDKQYNEQLNDLLKIQTKEYIQFVKNLTETQNIMSKTFFVVVPFTPTALGSGQDSSINKLFSKKKDSMGNAQKNDSFEENRSQLEQRVSVVQQGLSRCGIRSTVLDTESSIELLYKIFNPGDSEKPMKL